MTDEIETAGGAGEELETLDDGEARDAAFANGLPVLHEDAEDAGAALPKRAFQLPDGSVMLPLLHPVTLRYRSGRDGSERSQVYDKLHMRRLNGADMRAITAASTETAPVVAIGRSARLNPILFAKAFDLMDGRDVADAGAVIERFLGSGRRTG